MLYFCCFFHSPDLKRSPLKTMPQKKAAPPRTQAQISRDIDKLREVVDAIGDKIDKLAEGDEKTRRRIEEAEVARGRAAEAMFRKSLPAVLKKAGMKVDHVEPHSLRMEDREYDFVARNGKANFVGEIKIRFKARHLAQLHRALAKFREDYPEKAGDRPIYGVVCGMVVEDDAADIARREGLLVVEGRTKAKMRAKPGKIRDYAAK